MHNVAWIKKEIFMNFNYNNFDYNQKVFQKRVEKKAEEQEQEKGKVEEKKTAEEPKPRTMEVSEGVLRKTDEMVVNYAKAAMQIPENIGELKHKAVEGNLRDGNLEHLTSQWYHLSNNPDATYEDKLGLLNQIIASVGDNEQASRTWRLIKQELIFETLYNALSDYRAELDNGRPFIYTDCDYYFYLYLNDLDGEDNNLFNSYIEMDEYDYNSLSDHEKAAVCNCLTQYYNFWITYNQINEDYGYGALENIANLQQSQAIWQNRLEALPLQYSMATNEELLAFWNEHQNEYDFEQKMEILDTIIAICQDNFNESAITHWACIKSQTISEQIIAYTQEQNTENWDAEDMQEYLSTIDLYDSYYQNIQNLLNSCADNYDQLSDSLKIDLCNERIASINAVIVYCTFIVDNLALFNEASNSPANAADINDFINSMQIELALWQGRLAELDPVQPPVPPEQSWPADLPEDASIDELTAYYNTHGNDCDFETKINIINAILEQVGEDDNLRLHWLSIKMQTVMDNSTEQLQTVKTEGWTTDEIANYSWSNGASHLYMCYFSDDEVGFYLSFLPNNELYNSLPKSLKIDILRSRITEYYHTMAQHQFMMDHIEAFPEYTLEQINSLIAYDQSLLDNLQNELNELLGLVPSDPGNVAQGVVAPEDPPEPAQIDLDLWLTQWNEHETMSLDEQFDLLTNIIDAYGEGTAEARIWQMRRYKVKLEQRREELMSGTIPGSYAVSGPNDDFYAYQYYSNPAHFAELEPEQQIEYREIGLIVSSSSFLHHSILFNDNPDDERTQLRGNAISIMNNINSIAELSQDADWYNTYTNDFLPLFDTFANVMDDYSSIGHILELQLLNGEEAISAVQGLVNDMLGILTQLESNGFPYGSELRMAIQGYLRINEKYDNIVVWPAGEGNINPEAADPKKKLAQSTTNLK